MIIKVLFNTESFKKKLVKIKFKTEFCKHQLDMQTHTDVCPGNPLAARFFRNLAGLISEVSDISYHLLDQ